jgi:hypothetical protein
MRYSENFEPSERKYVGRLDWANADEFPLHPHPVTDTIRVTAPTIQECCKEILKRVPTIDPIALNGLKVSKGRFSYMHLALPEKKGDE